MTRDDMLHAAAPGLAYHALELAAMELTAERAASLERTIPLRAVQIEKGMQVAFWVTGAVVVGAVLKFLLTNLPPQTALFSKCFILFMGCGMAAASWKLATLLAESVLIDRFANPEQHQLLKLLSETENGADALALVKRGSVAVCAWHREATKDGAQMRQYDYLVMQELARLDDIARTKAEDDKIQAVLKAERDRLNKAACLELHQKT